MKKISLLMTLATFIATTTAKSSPPETSLVDRFQMEEVVERFNALEDLLRGALSLSGSCEDGPDAPAPGRLDRCNFENFCGVLEGSSDSAYIYTNAQGGRTPNYRLAALEERLSQCFNSVQAKFPVAQELEEYPAEDPMLEGVLDQARRTAQARRNLLTAISEEGKQAQFIEFEQAAASFALEQVDSEEFDPYSSMVASPEELGVQFDEIASRAGVEFSSRIRGLYVESILAQRPAPMEHPSFEEGPDFAPEPVRPSINQNPFMNPLVTTQVGAAGSRERVLANQRRVQAAVRRSEGYFNETKESIIEILRERMARLPAGSSGRQGYELMIRRVQTIRFNPPPTDPQAAMEDCPGPNAFYSPTSHAFTLCPQIMELPESGVKTIIAHEIAHSFDPCSLSQTLLRVTGERNSSPQELPFEADGAPPAAADAIPFELERREYPDAYMVDYLGNGQQNLEREYSSFEVREEIAGVPLAQNPGASVIQCLASPESVSARMPNREQTRDDINLAIQRLEAAGVPSNDPEYQRLLDVRTNLDQIYNEVGACGFLPGNSQMQEAWSDWVAGEVIARELPELPQNRRYQYALESGMFFLATTCRPHSDVEERAVELMGQMECLSPEGRMRDVNTILEVAASNQDVHSHSVDRIERILISHHEIKRTLGCSPDEGGRYCE